MTLDEKFFLYKIEPVIRSIIYVKWFVEIEIILPLLIISLLENILLGLKFVDWFKLLTQIIFKDLELTAYNDPYVFKNKIVSLKEERLFINLFFTIDSYVGISLIIDPLSLLKKYRLLFWVAATNLLSMIFKLDLKGIL